MKRMKYLLLLLLLITSSVYSQNVKITDFDIPVSSARQFFLNGNYVWNQTDYSNSNVVDSNGNKAPKAISSSYLVSGVYNQFYSSPSYAWNLGLTGQIYGDRSDTILSPNYQYIFNADISKYFRKDKGFFVNGAVSSTFQKKQEFIPLDSSYNRPQIDLFAGLGYGRMVNASALSVAINIDQELRRSRVTSSYLPKQTMLNISHIIDQESEYKTKYKQLYKAKMVEAIQNEIDATGLNDKQLKSIEYFRIQSILFETYEGNINYNQNYPRYYGGDIRLGIGYQPLTRNEVIEIPTASLEARGRYGYPIGLYHQLYGTFALGTSMDSTFGKVWSGTGAVTYWYNMTNRIRFNAGYTLNLVRDFTQSFDTTTSKIVTNSSDFSYTNHVVNAGFLFYLENYVSLLWNVTYNFDHNISNRLGTTATASFIIF
jgi:hypothetical protein